MLNAFFNVGGTSVTNTNELIDQLDNSHLYGVVILQVYHSNALELRFRKKNPFTGTGLSFWILYS